MENRTPVENLFIMERNTRFSIPAYFTRTSSTCFHHAAPERSKVEKTKTFLGAGHLVLVG